MVEENTGRTVTVSLGTAAGSRIVQEALSAVPDAGIIRFFPGGPGDRVEVWSRVTSVEKNSRSIEVG